jgi:hypothetical protein
LNLLAAVYWWNTRNYIFLLLPLLTALDKKMRFASPAIFFIMAIYCFILEHNYRQIQNELFGFHSNLCIEIEDIHVNELKNNYKITGCVKLKTSKATIQIFSKEAPEFEIGDSIECKGLLFKEPASRDYRKYLLKENIHGTTYSSKLLVKVVDHKERVSLYIKNTLGSIDKKISQKLSKPAGILFSSLFLGSKKYSETQDLAIKDYFNRWGINHFLARSGLHVTLILFLIVLIGRLFLIPFGYLNLLTVLFLFIYSVISYTSTSFLRAFITALCALFCLISRVPINSLHLLTITFLITLLYNPFLALFLDFQLTFLLTWGLCILAFLDF